MVSRGPEYPAGRFLADLTKWMLTEDVGTRPSARAIVSKLTEEASRRGK